MPDTDAPAADRIPVRFANYDGDRRRELLADPVMGPNMLREAMTVVTADYDQLTDRTRAGFAFTTMPDLESHPTAALVRLMAADAHPALFRKVI